MSSLDRGLLQVDDDGEDFLEVLDFSLEFLVSVPFFQILGESDALVAVLLDLIFNFLELLDGDVGPTLFLPLGDGFNDFGVKRVEFLEVLEFGLSLL